MSAQPPNSGFPDPNVDPATGLSTLTQQPPAPAPAQPVAPMAYTPPFVEQAPQQQVQPPQQGYKTFFEFKPRHDQTKWAVNVYQQMQSAIMNADHAHSMYGPAAVQETKNLAVADAFRSFYEMRIEKEVGDPPDITFTKDNATPTPASKKKQAAWEKKNEIAKAGIRDEFKGVTGVLVAFDESMLDPTFYFVGPA